jgi:hypothetical protein
MKPALPTRQLALTLLITALIGCGTGTNFFTRCATTAKFSFTTLSVTGDTFTQLLGVNNAGLIAGYHGSGADAQHPNQGFTLKPPMAFAKEDFPNSVQTQVIGINTKGDTVGFYVDAGGQTHGFSDLKGVFTTVDAPGTNFNQLLGVNDKGGAAGYSQDATGAQQAYTVQGTTFTPIMTPGTSAQATGINNNGDVSGFYVDAMGTTHGFIVPAGKTLVTVDFMGSTFTQVLGLNNLRDAVGTYTDMQGAIHGFIYSIASGKFETIDNPNTAAGTAANTVVNGINDKGTVVGFYMDAAGNTNGFKAVATGCM